MFASCSARISSRLVALQRPQDKVAEKEAEARGGAADVALTPSSYDFERRLTNPSPTPILPLPLTLTLTLTTHPHHSPLTTRPSPSP